METQGQSGATRLFVASCMALVVTSMSFAIRGDIMGPLEQEFGLTHEQSGQIAGTAFWGFTLAMVFGGPLCDWLGMGRLLVLAFIGHLAGIAITLCANGYGLLFAGTLAIGLGNGLVEAACNPLVATLYPNDKTHKLNQFHVWFPGGIVIGGLLAFAMTKMGLGWQAKMATMLLPTLIYGAMFFRAGFPKTERVESGVSTGGMFKACLHPMFILLVGCMLLSAATELGTNQWISNILSKMLSAGSGLGGDVGSALGGGADGSTGIMVLVWISGIMALGRQFAGPIVHRASPVGMLLFSAVFSAIGLFWLSFASSTATAFAAATVFSVGICYFWPTMIGLTSEKLPKTGALGMAIMGGAGMLSVSIILPVMGKIYDKEGGAMALRYVSALPVVLVVVFGLMLAYYVSRGGYKVEKISGAEDRAGEQ